MASRAQPGGPAWFVSEFGATSNSSVLRAATAIFDRELVGWAYWSWKFYGDPTGSSDEALVRATGRLAPKARVLSQPYAEAIAGRPLSMAFAPASGSFSLRYRAARRGGAPTLVVVPRALRYPRGYCVHVEGVAVVSPRGSSLLEVVNRKNARTVAVGISVRHGRCR